MQICGQNRIYIICVQNLKLIYFNLKLCATTLFNEKDEVRIRAFGSTSHCTANTSFATSRSARIRVFTLLLASRQSPYGNKNGDTLMRVNSQLYLHFISARLVAKEKYHPRQFNVRNGTRVRLQGLEPCTPCDP